MRRGRLAAAAVLAMLVAPGHWWRSAVSVDTSYTLDYVALPATTPADWPEGLTLQQAWHLDAANSAFSGFSALLINSDGFRGFTDFGHTATIPRPARRSLRVPVPALPFIPEITATPDVEAAAFDRGSGDLWLSYEHHNAIRRIGADGVSAIAFPPELRGLGDNSGIEAMARLRDGRFVMLSERGAQGYLFAGDPVDGAQAVQFAVAWPDEYRPTDMAQLPDGRVLVLLRQIEWSLPPFSTRLAIGDPATIRAGEVWSLEPLATLAMAPLRENYEGLAVEPAADGGLNLWLISDSNRATLQRTLLLKLHWATWHTKTAREDRIREPQNP